MFTIEKNLEILLVEDSREDADLVREGFDSADIPYHLHIISDGSEVMPFLHHEEKYKEAPHPDLILLDLNMPKRNGMEVLADIKMDRNYSARCLVSFIFC